MHYSKSSVIQFDMLFHPIFLYEYDLICICITINELVKTNEGKSWKNYILPWWGGNETPFLAHLRQYIMGAKLFSGATYMRNNITVNVSGM